MIALLSLGILACKKSENKPQEETKSNPPVVVADTFDTYHLHFQWKYKGYEGGYGDGYMIGKDSLGNQIFTFLLASYPSTSQWLIPTYPVYPVNNLTFTLDTNIIASKKVKCLNFYLRIGGVSAVNDSLYTDIYLNNTLIAAEARKQNDPNPVSIWCKP